MHLVLGELWNVPLMLLLFSWFWEMPYHLSRQSRSSRWWKVDKISLYTWTMTGCPIAYWSRWLCTSSLGQPVSWFPAQITELETGLSAEMLTLARSQLSFCLLHLFSDVLPLKWGFWVAWSWSRWTGGCLDSLSSSLLLFFLVNSFICKMTVSVYSGYLHDNEK